jgi:hypothetical protein
MKDAIQRARTEPKGTKDDQKDRLERRSDSERQDLRPEHVDSELLPLAASE